MSKFTEQYYGGEAVVAPGAPPSRQLPDPENHVGYGKLMSVLIKAIKEQRAQIESQRDEIDILKSILCADHPEAEICE